MVRGRRRANRPARAIRASLNLLSRFTFPIPSTSSHTEWFLGTLPTQSSSFGTAPVCQRCPEIWCPGCNWCSDQGRARWTGRCSCSRLEALNSGRALESSKNYYFLNTHLIDHRFPTPFPLVILMSNEARESDVTAHGQPTLTAGPCWHARCVGRPAAFSGFPGLW